MRNRSRHHHPISRALRHHQTASEKILWQSLRLRRFAGFKFRHQHTIGPYVVDFACPRSRLVVEIDGPDHARHPKKDTDRTIFLMGKRYKVIRFRDREVLKDLEAVLARILRELKRR